MIINYLGAKTKSTLNAENITDLPKTLMRKHIFLAINFSYTSTDNQAEQIQKGELCIEILLEIHLT